MNKSIRTHFLSFSHEGLLPTPTERSRTFSISIASTPCSSAGDTDFYSRFYQKLQRTQPLPALQTQGLSYRGLLAATWTPGPTVSTPKSIKETYTPCSGHCRKLDVALAVQQLSFTDVARPSTKAPTGRRIVFPARSQPRLRRTLAKSLCPDVKKLQMCLIK